MALCFKKRISNLASFRQNTPWAVIRDKAGEKLYERYDQFLSSEYVRAHLGIRQKVKSPQRVHHCEETLFSWWWRSLLGSPTFVFLVRLFCFSLFLFVLLCPLSNSFSNKVDQNSPLVMKKTRKVSPKS